MRYYDKWRTNIETCRHCEWSGKGSDFVTGEVYRELVGRVCPRCGEEAFVVELPTPEEILAAGDRADPVDRLQAEIIIERTR
jgi:superfamily II helicase